MTVQQINTSTLAPSTRLVIAFVLGVIQVFCYAPYEQGWLIIPLISLLILMAPKDKIFAYAYCYGLGLFIHGTWWIYISIHTPSYGLDSKSLAFLFSAAFILWLALFPACSMSLYRRYKSKSVYNNALLFASFWLLTEYARSHLLTGYPWMTLGDSQLTTPLAHLYPIFGSEGISWVIAFFASLWSQVLERPSLRHKLISIGSLLLLIILSYNLKTEWTQSRGTIKTAMIQNNVPLASKWKQSLHATIVNDYKDAANRALDHSPDLIILPEAALPSPSWIPYALSDLDHEAKNQATMIIAGIPLFEGHKAFNGAIAFGFGSGNYKKQHLVPFGEFWPLQSWLGENARFFNMPMSMYSHGSNKQVPILYKDKPLATFICYEITYPPLVRDSLQESELIITITDDVWFGTSIARDQHLEIARIRSKETGRSQAFVANTGITAAIDDQGNIFAQLPTDKADRLDTTLTLRQGQTPLLRYGNLWLYLFSCTWVLIAFVRQKIPLMKGQ